MCVVDWKPLFFVWILQFYVCPFFQRWFYCRRRRGFLIIDICVCSTASNLMISLWYICVCVCLLCVFPSHRRSVHANRKAVFFSLFLLIKLLFFCFPVWIIYYYYYSIIKSEIKKRSLQKKKENVGPPQTFDRFGFRRVFFQAFAYLFLFCFVLLVKKKREQNWILN